jgi:CHASE2 domain-containing sensor protein
VLLVGFIPHSASPKSLPSVVMQSIATEQIMRNQRPHQSLPTPIFILLWSGVSSIMILQRKWQIILPAGIILLSLGSGSILFANGIIAPFALIVVTVTTASILIRSIHLSINSINP